MSSCLSTKDNSTVKLISKSFKALNSDSNYKLETLLDAQSIVLEFYTLYKTGNLTADGLNKITSQINSENGDVLKQALGSINQGMAKEELKDKKKKPQVLIPEKFSQPSLSKMKNKLKLLLSDYKFNEDITVPEKFEFNGTSIPEIAQEWLGNPFDKKLEVPGLVHDYLYSPKSKSLNYNKATADLAFYHLLKKNEVPESKALVMYMGVVIGGHFFYMKD